MEISFEGKNILISGAAGQVGQRLAKDFCLSNASTLILLDSPNNEKEMLRMQKELSDKVNIKIYTADFNDLDEISRTVESLTADNIYIDILVNNAGLNILKKATETDGITWDMIHNVNLKGSFFLTKLVAQSSLINQKGNIIFVSSQHGVVGNIMRTAYCSSKAGVIGLVKALTAEWSVFGVRVNAISPTYIINENNKSYLMSPREKRNMLNKIPLNKYAIVDDISNAVLFMSSDKASMITGHNLIVDGGYTSL